MPYYEQYQLAAGNNNAAGLSPIETILAGYEAISVGLPSVPPQAWGTFQKSNNIAIRGNGRALFRGFPFSTWPFGFISFTQIEGLRTNYCGGGYDGFVTVRTRTDTHATYANFNAVMTLPQLGSIPQSSYRHNGIISYTITFTRMVAL